MNPVRSLQTNSTKHQKSSHFLPTFQLEIIFTKNLCFYIQQKTRKKSSVFNYNYQKVFFPPFNLSISIAINNNNILTLIYSPGKRKVIDIGGKAFFYMAFCLHSQMKIWFGHSECNHTNTFDSHFGVFTNVVTNLYKRMDEKWNLI